MEKSEKPKPWAEIRSPEDQGDARMSTDEEAKDSKPEPVRICPALLEQCPHRCSSEQVEECERIASGE